MKRTLALAAVLGLAPSLALAYGGSYANVELRRAKKKSGKQAAASPAAHGARSSSGAMVSEMSSGGPAASSGAQATPGVTAPPAVGGGAAGGGFGSFGASSLGCPQGTDKDPKTGRCITSPSATTVTALGAGATATQAAATNAATTGGPANAASTLPTAPPGYGSAPGYGSTPAAAGNNNSPVGAGAIGAQNAATQNVKQ